MIYTVGHTRNYISAIDAARDGRITKLGKRAPGEDDRFPGGYPGGSVWLTREAAQTYLDTLAHNDFSVFGVDCDWSNTEPPDMPSATWHNLIEDAYIVEITEEQMSGEDFGNFDDL